MAILNSLNPYLKSNSKVKFFKYFLYLLCFFICLIIGMYILSRYSSTYIQYNATRSIETGFYLMQECKLPLKKGQLITFHHEKPVWISSPHWIDRSLKRVAGIPGDIVSVNDDNSLMKICSNDGNCLEYHRYSHLPIDKTSLGKIPADFIFATGDHSDSLDSRYYGLIKSTEIISCATFLL